MEKVRLDEAIVNKGLVANRSKAKEHITNRKEVYVNNVLITKAGHIIKESDLIELKINQNTYVSRAGLKLEKALKYWNIDLKDKVCLDIGASTGGFTEVCLENGAKHIYAVDVGTDQLDLKLRNNEKISNMQQFNFRNAKRDDFDQVIQFVCCDVSFISLDKILIALGTIIEENVECVFLLKPQFEVGIESWKGKVNSKQAHFNVIKKFVRYSGENGFIVKEINFSPILGNKKQNIEYLINLEKKNEIVKWKDDSIWKVVDSAWKELNK